MITVNDAPTASYGILQQTSAETDCDEVAGHCRRNNRVSIEALATASGWKMLHTARLTFPVSNLLLPTPNFLVNRCECSKLDLSLLERTRQSDRREVKFKTHFPSVLGLLLNESTMYPLYFLQKLFARSELALMLYLEAQPAPGAARK